jgi:ABC-type Fe3+/spermidine/putrescine transport system ATPase subunit
MKKTLPRQPILQARRISKRFFAKLALDTVSFSLFPGETLAIMGLSGSGKTTLLRILAGLEKPSQGSVMLGGKDITDLPSERRNIGFVFQHYALFPHMSVYDNLAFPLRLRHQPRQFISERVAQALETIGMQQFQRRKPTSLSGGERQRVAIMRAVISEPPILLLDEPFTALDRHLIEQLQMELWRIKKTFQMAIVLVAHDPPFAMSISDQVLIMKDGQVRQIGTPREVFEQPSERFVANFLGKINFIVGKLVKINDDGLGTVKLSSGAELEVLLTPQLRRHQGKDVTIAIRPNRVRLSSHAAELAIGGVVRALHYRGAQVVAGVMVDDNTTIYAELNTDESTSLAEGRKVVLWWDKNDACILEN